jgi:hypothetical protein
MKTTSIKFTRNPQFTPTSLTVRQLSRIEWIVKALFERNYRNINGKKSDFPLRSGKEAAFDMTKNWFAPAWASDPDGGRNCQMVPERKANHDRRIAWLSNNPDAMRYFANCWNYLMAIAKRNGEVEEPTRYSRREWAEIRGSY